MRIKLFFSTLFLLLSFCDFAQQGKLLLEVKGLPVRDGKIYKFEGHGCHSGIIEIISKTDSVFSNVDGIISFASILVDEYAVIIKTQNKVFVGFGKLKTTSLKKGAQIKKGDFIGLINPDDDRTLSLLFILTDERGAFFSETSTIDFVKKSDNQTCANNDYPIVVL
jgi:hypothetical protein